MFYKNKLAYFVSFFLISLISNAIAQLSEPYIVRNNVRDCLNVRREPNTDAEIIECLQPGTPVTVIGTVPYWREIAFGVNQRGWAAKKFLQPAVQPEPSVPEPGVIPQHAYLEVHFVDVGQGDAIWIQTHDDAIDGNGIFEGYSIVIDGGPYFADHSNPLLPYLRERSHRGAEIEALIVTHPHSDHYYGAETISRHFDIQNYYDPGFPSTSGNYIAFIEAMTGTNTTQGRARHMHRGRENFGTLNWGNELDVEVLYSWPGHNTGLGSGSTRINNSSIVLRMQYGQHVFLFMGDAEGKDREDDPGTARYVEQILLENFPERLPATVLKVGHHGSETSSTTPFINAVNPSIVIVQSGRISYSGRYIPDASTLQRYCNHNTNVRIYRTDQNDEADGLNGREAADGDHIIIRTNGTGQPQVEAFEGGQPF